jgi:HEAT repeat protein
MRHQTAPPPEGPFSFTLNCVNELTTPEKIAEVEAIRGHERDPEEARARLEELLADKDDDVRAEAAGAVWEHSEAPGLVARALELATKDGSPRVRAKALTALGRVLYEGSVAGAEEPGYTPDALLGEPPLDVFRKVRGELLSAAKDEKRGLDERRFALEGLGFLGDDAEIGTLIESFWKRSEPAARLSAVFAMGRSGDARWAGPIREALGAPADEIRLQAIWAAGEAEVQPAREALVALAKSAHRLEERIAAIEALARLGGEPVAQLLLALAENDHDPEVREAAATGLEALALLDAIEEEEDGDDDDEGD